MYSKPSQSVRLHEMAACKWHIGTAHKTVDLACKTISLAVSSNAPPILLHGYTSSSVDMWTVRWASKATDSTWCWFRSGGVIVNYRNFKQTTNAMECLRKQLTWNIYCMLWPYNAFPLPWDYHYPSSNTSAKWWNKLKRKVSPTNTYMSAVEYVSYACGRDTLTGLWSGGWAIIHTVPMHARI